MKNLDKERILLYEMQKDGFAKYFDGSRTDALWSIERAMESFVNYVDAVTREQVLTPVYRIQYEGQELRDHISALDDARRSSHNSAIANIKTLNRLNNAYGLGNFADIDTQNRQEVADFVGEFVSEIYSGGIHHSIDEIVKDSVEKGRNFPRATLKNTYENINKTACEIDDFEL